MLELQCGCKCWLGTRTAGLLQETVSLCAHRCPVWFLQKAETLKIDWLTRCIYQTSLSINMKLSVPYTDHLLDWPVQFGGKQKLWQKRDTHSLQVLKVSRRANLCSSISHQALQEGRTWFLNSWDVWFQVGICSNLLSLCLGEELLFCSWGKPEFLKPER